MKDTSNTATLSASSAEEKEKCTCFWKAAFFLISFFILPLVACPILGQAVQKKQLSEADYKEWGELITDQASPDRKWISFRMQYDGREETLYVRNVESLKTYLFPKVTRAEFTSDNNVLCMDKDKNLIIQNLKSGTKKIYSNVSSMNYSSPAHLLAILQSNSNFLQLINTNDSSVSTLPNVEKFVMSPDKKNIAFTAIHNNVNSVGLLNLMKPSPVEWIIENSPNSFDRLTWDDSSISIAFYGFTKPYCRNSILYFYNSLEGKCFELNPSGQSDFLRENYIDKDGRFPLRISQDAKKVFFSLSTVENRSSALTDVEIWNASDQFIYPLQKFKGNYIENKHLAVWIPEKKTFNSITSSSLPIGTLTGDDQYAIVCNPKDYEPQLDTDGPMDFYTIDLETNQKDKIVEKQSAIIYDLLASPSGKYISYFKDNAWWVYDIRKKTTANVTQKIGVPFSGKVYLNMSNNCFGAAGWSSDDSDFIIYDQYDLWKVKPDGSSFERLTHGREKEIKFRIAVENESDRYDFVYDRVKSKTIDLNQEIILKALGGDKKAGYFKWNKDVNEKAIVYEDLLSDKIYFLKNRDIYIYKEERFDLPPRFVLKEKNKKPKVVYQSNPHHFNFQWSKPKLIYYSNSRGQDLKGILYYPFNYDKNKKYPMIVNIYEYQSNRLHKFYNPTLFQSYGYNPPFLCSKDYFVLSPDIEQENGNIGGSALDCTLTAVKEILKLGIIDEKRIGLMGHSFGGYETNYIVTATDIFACAVSGASISDLSSFYLSIDKNFFKPNATRFQTDEQWRMGKSLFEDTALYLKNSPVHNAAAINTPLLLWTGKEDYHVPWYQSVELHMALRILKKPSKMLLYPNEGHTVEQENNQIDLSKRILEWFDYYLKCSDKI
ncbi:prolyl oligopeptidase family serine peptidase [Flavobacterium chungangensis]|uniref:Prolyl oligopeptidase family serine peptidase n=1 Tax=Flavobacterium chungangensis TaxID=2708132 RepID=A0ABV8ZFY4_9FLAO